MNRTYLLFGTTLLLLGATATACSSGSQNDAPDASEPDGSQPDATPLRDASPDAHTAPDATVSDGGSDAPTADVHTVDSGDGGLDCTALVAKMLAAAAAPPNKWAGLDLSKGGDGGLTIEEADILACATSVEPASLDGGEPAQPGSRTATFGAGDGGAPVSVSYNLDTHVISFVYARAPATTTLTFHARAGGAYDKGAPDGGPTEYVIGVGPGGGYVKRNGIDFPADWTNDDAGAFHASAWANEIYDGIMATFDPSAPAVANCASAPFERAGVPQRVPACLIINDQATTAVFGVRPLGAYVSFDPATNRPNGIYEVWPGGQPSCASPHAAIEEFDFQPIYPQWNRNLAIGPQWGGMRVGTVTPAENVTNAAGMLASEVNTILGCNGTAATAENPGYEAKQWGSGEVALEYKADSGVAYKLYARQGYHGALDAISYLDDGGTREYLVGVGSLTVNGAPVTLDWTGGDAGTLNAAITDISNALLESYCGVQDVDCVQAGDCAIVPDDGHGHSTFTLMMSPQNIPPCTDWHPLTVVFPKGGSAPSEIVATNPGGQ